MDAVNFAGVYGYDREILDPLDISLKSLGGVSMLMNNSSP
jgi:hypothetical protein